MSYQVFLRSVSTRYEYRTVSVVAASASHAYCKAICHDWQVIGIKRIEYVN